MAIRRERGGAHQAGFLVLPLEQGDGQSGVEALKARDKFGFMEAIKPDDYDLNRDYPELPTTLIQMTA